MKQFWRIILFILICWFGYAAFRQTLEPQRKGLLYLLQHFNLIILILLLVSAIVSDVSAYRLYPKFFQFYTSTTALFLCSIVLMRLIKYNNIEKCNTIYSALPKSGSKNFIAIQFKEEGNIVIRDMHSPMPFIYYGKYFKIKDTITITQTNYDSFSDTLPVSGIFNGERLIWKNGDTMLLDISK